jgi:hypothetical protein
MIEPVDVEQPPALPASPRSSEWHSCCLTVDRDFVMYISQMGVIILVMGFCIAQLLIQTSCDYQIAYTGLLTMLIGLVIPSPAIRRR